MGGELKDVTVDHLAEKVIRELMERTGSDIKVDEVILGQAKQSADTSNLARLAALRAELPIDVSGYTVIRQCGSSLQAINNADMQIQLGLSDVVVAGGAESMSTAPYYLSNARQGYRAGNGLLLDPNTESQPCSQTQEKYGNRPMGLTAENLAGQYSICRAGRDGFARRSRVLVDEGIKEGSCKKEIVRYEL